jgi:lycopene beta-cyclase
MHYNYIFSGAGLSSLMTLVKMADNGLLEGKKVLVVEPEAKNTNDRTWCYWEKGTGNWDAIVLHQWEKAFFISKKNKIECLQGVYNYKMIESSQFYSFCKEKLQKYDVKWLKDSVISFNEQSEKVEIITHSSAFTAEYFFNSVIDLQRVENNIKYPFLQQHFVGWFIESNKPVFNPNEASFMDFTVVQKGNTRFMYVLPKSETEALIEYTLFSPNLLKEEEYEIEIQKYLSDLGIVNYKIQTKEKGVIPMTTYPFWKSNSKRILNIGAAGGWTKASTGYTFKNTDKYTDKIIYDLKKSKLDFSRFKKANRYTFYDDLFLDVLYNNNSLGEKIFSAMFSNGNSESIFKFLDEVSNLKDDMSIILSCPKLPFLKSFFRRVLKIK